LVRVESTPLANELMLLAGVGMLRREEKANGRNWKAAGLSLTRESKLRLILLFALSICSGCRYSAAPYYGQLVVADENGITLVQLPSISATVLLSTQGSTSLYGHPTLVAPGVIIFNTAQRLARFDLRTKELADVGEGIWPTYVAEQHVLFFLESGQGSKQPRNRVVRMRSLSGPATEGVVASFSDVWSSRIVQISSNEIVFYGASSRVWKYSIATSILSPTGVGRCLPMAWRSKTGQLICQNVDDRRIYLAFLTGQTTPIPIRSYEVLGYSPNYDAVIYSESYESWWRLEVGWAIVAYNFRDRRTVRLAWSAPGATCLLLDREGEPL
jgi:hypothetical protein